MSNALVKLSLTDGREIWIAPRHVATVCSHGSDPGRCWVDMTGDNDGGWLVACSVEQAIEALLEVEHD